MGNSTIGIKIADGSFYPVVEKDAGGWKRLVLTTVRDGQTSVQIDLYEGEDLTIDSARYVGSLLIEEIAPAAAGETEIELQVGVEEDGKLSARAEDLSSGESQSLNVSLESLAADSVYDIPEFELGDEFDTWSDDEEVEENIGEVTDERFDESFGDSFDEPFDDSTDESYGEPEEYQQRTRRRPILLALFIVLGIAAIAALSIFLFELFQGPEVPALEARGENQVEIADTEDTADIQPADQEEDAVDTGAAGDTQARDGPVIAAASDAPPPASEQSLGGVWYWIRWGDTLWDISSSFYRNPWRYGTIAEENSIRNPDLIFAGAKIYIPQKE